MARIIAVANQKGGVGKTTTTINLSACLAQLGRRVLTVDADPQGNTTTGLGLRLGKGQKIKTLYDALLGDCLLGDAINKTKITGLFLVPSNIDLSGAEIELIGMENREYILKNLLKSFVDYYDFIIFDCPPSLNVLTINALAASDSVLVPIQCEYYALEGLTQLLKTIDLVKRKLNPGLAIEGVVFTMYDARTNLSMQVVEEVKRHLGKDVYRSVIPRNVRLSEAPSHGLPISLYDPKSKGAEAYELLAQEVIQRGGY